MSKEISVHSFGALPLQRTASNGRSTRQKQFSITEVCGTDRSLPPIPNTSSSTRVYNSPPYQDAREAVRSGVDYILAAGDSWHANTPRRGGILDRVSSVHKGASLCVACHTTHFPLRAQLYAARNGYPVVQRQQFQCLTDRFYNNPRPFYRYKVTSITNSRSTDAPLHHVEGTVKVPSLASRTVQRMMFLSICSRRPRWVTSSRKNA